MNLLHRWLDNGVIAWLGFFGCGFLALELPARDILGVWPWPSLSKFIWDSIHWWHLIAVAVFVFMGVLLGHFELHWAARFLVATGALITAAVVIRATWGLL